MKDFDLESLARSVLGLGDLRIDVGRLTVLGRGEEGKLTPKAMAVLIELARFPQQTVTRNELLDRVWPDTQPTPDVLSHAVRELRRALGDDARAPLYIDTVHGLGYRLLIAACVEDAEVAAPIAPVALEPAPATVAAEPSPLASPPPPSRAWPNVTLVVATLVMLVAALAWFARPRPAPATETVVTAGWTPRLATSDPGAEEFPKLSPDGAMIAFTRRATPEARWDLGVMSVAGSEPLALTRTPDEDELWPVWSPDGAWLAFLHIDGEQCGVEVMPATGGAARRVAACDRVVFSAIDWSPDGSHLLTALPSGGAGNELRVHRVPVDGGAPQAIAYEVGRPGWDRDPMYSPDGTQIAFRRGLPPDYDVFVMPANGGTARRLTRVGSIGEGLAWLPGGRELVVWSQHEGKPALYRVDVASGALRATGVDNATRPHVARAQARLAFQRPWLRVGMVTVDVAQPAAAPVPLSESTGSVGFIASSPDRARLAYVSDRGGAEQVWVHEPGRADRPYGDDSLRRISSLDWSDDGNRLLLVARRGDADHAVQLDLDTGRFTDLGLSRPLLRDAVGSASPDRLYAIVQGADRPLLARFDRVGTQWQETVSEIPATELIRLPGVPGVFGRTPLRPDVIVQVGDDLTLREIALQPRVYGWTASGGAVWYLATRKRATSELRRHDLATGEDVYVRAMPHHMPRRRASIGMLGDHAVIALLLEDAADIGLIELDP